MQDGQVSNSSISSTKKSSKNTSRSLLDTHATVNLPIRNQRLPPARPTASKPGRAVRRLPPPIPLPRGSDDLPCAPVPPPRPESTLSSRSTRIVESPGGGVPRVPPIEPLTSLEEDQRAISLNSPRPGQARSQNVYVDAPLTNSTNSSNSSSPAHRFSSSPIKSESSNHNSSSSSAVIKCTKNTPTLSDIVITSSPLSPTSSSLSSDSFPPESIICRDCGRCRCEACRTPRKLPQKWICGDKYLCSAGTVVDALSCYCCVRGIFYHCRKDFYEGDRPDVDKPCSCSADNVCLRWSCVSAMSLIMPCLWCYVPLRGCVKATEVIYAKCTGTGCTCHTNNNRTLITQQPTSIINNNNNNNNNNIKIDSQKRLLR